MDDTPASDSAQVLTTTSSSQHRLPGNPAAERASDSAPAPRAVRQSVAAPGAGNANNLCEKEEEEGHLDREPPSLPSSLLSHAANKPGGSAPLDHSADPSEPGSSASVSWDEASDGKPPCDMAALNELVVHDVTGTAVPFGELHSGPTVVIFARHVLCVFCMAFLHALNARAVPILHAQGVRVIAITTAKAKHLAWFKAQHSLDMELYSNHSRSLYSLLNFTYTMTGYSTRVASHLPSDGLGVRQVFNAKALLGGTGDIRQNGGTIIFNGDDVTWYHRDHLAGAQAEIHDILLHAGVAPEVVACVPRTPFKVWLKNGGDPFGSSSPSTPTVRHSTSSTRTNPLSSSTSMSPTLAARPATAPTSPNMSLGAALSSRTSSNPSVGHTSTLSASRPPSSSSVIAAAASAAAAAAGGPSASPAAPGSTSPLSDTSSSLSCRACAASPSSAGSRDSCPHSQSPSLALQASRGSLQDSAGESSVKEDPAAVTPN